MSAAAPPATPAPALSLVMPLFNEEAGIEHAALALFQTLSYAQLPTQVILVDNGSTDGTRARIEALLPHLPGFELLHLPTNRGYGGGILAGLRQTTAPVLGYLWGDEQIAPYAAVRAYQHLLEGSFDLVKARRTVRLDGLERRIVSAAYHTLFPLFFPVHLKDLHGCPKLFTRATYEALHPTAEDWFLDAQLLIGATRLGLRIGEVDVVYWPRQTGRSKVRLNTLLEFGLNLVRYRVKPGTGLPPRP